MAAGRDRTKEKEEPTLARNRAASHEYHLLDRWEAGIVLTGPEVKPARAGQVNLKGPYARVRNGEVFLLDAHFSPYEQAPADASDPTRDRKLLLHTRGNERPLRLFPSRRRAHSRVRSRGSAGCVRLGRCIAARPARRGRRGAGVAP